MSRLTATYRIRAEAGAIEERAKALAVEQSVEMPVSAITDTRIRDEIVGQVGAIRDRHDGSFEVQIELASATVGFDAGQLLNMLFGNSSLHDDITLEDFDLPAFQAEAFGGPRHGLSGLRARCAADTRAMTCTALKPQGLSPGDLAALAGALAEGGIDFIKDDHGLADQAFCPFAERVPACATAIRQAAQRTNHKTRYAPSLSGDLDALRRQITIARGEGLDTVLVAPLIIGLSNVHSLVRSSPDIAFLAHPAMAGAARISPPMLTGKLFRLLGADAVIFPNYGGRFGYSETTCAEIARSARAPWLGLKSATPVPAGGMTLDRIPEMLDFYGPDVMLLIGGALLAAGERLSAESAVFVQRVANHGYASEFDK